MTSAVAAGVPINFGRNLVVDFKDVDESRERFLRSNRGGDDLATRIVFVVILLAIAAWIVALNVNGHRATDPLKAPRPEQHSARPR